MKLAIRYDNQYQTIVLSDKETESMWVSLSLDGEGLSQEEKEKLIQDSFEEQFNKPEYNNWHKHDRHQGNAVMKDKDGKSEINTEEAIMAKATDTSAFFTDMNNLENKFSYEEWCEKIRKAMKPSYAEMIIAIVLDGMTVGEYAVSIGEADANKVSHRYRRAVKKFKEIFPRTSF